MDSIEERVKEIIADQIGCEKDSITSDVPFEELGADSLDVIEIIITIEEEWSLCIPDEEAEEIHNLGEAVACIETKIEQGIACGSRVQ